MYFLPSGIQWFCICRLQGCSPGAAELRWGLSEVGGPSSGSQGGPRPQSVLLRAQQNLHQTLCLPRTGQHARGAGGEAAASAGEERASGAPSGLLQRGWSREARDLPPGQSEGRRARGQRSDRLQIRAAGKQERCASWRDAWCVKFHSKTWWNCPKKWVIPMKRKMKHASLSHSSHLKFVFY